MLAAAVLGQQGAAGGGAVTVVGTAVLETGTASTDVDATLPSGATGDLLLVVVAFGNADPVFTVAAGWTLLYNTTGLATQVAAYRVTDGSEGASATVGTATNDREQLSVTYRLQDVAASSFIEAATTTNIDPPSLSPSWGATDTLWITCASCRRTTNTFTMPSGYSSQVGGASSVNDAGARLETARLSLNASSEDPATWSSTGTTFNTRSSTIAVRPA